MRWRSSCLTGCVASVDKLAAARAQPNPHAVMRLSSIAPRSDNKAPPKSVSLEQVKAKLEGRSTPLPSRASVVSVPPTAVTAKANHAPSFRVYSPAEVANLPMRPGHRPAPAKGLREEVKESWAVARAASPMKIVKWVASAAFAMLLFFVFILVVANASDDTLTVKKADATLRSPAASAKSVAEAASALAAAPSSASPPRGEVREDRSKNDFELPGDETPPQRTAVVNKPKPVPKQGRRSVTIRNAPF